jgi:hypothetical protein
MTPSTSPQPPPGEPPNPLPLLIPLAPAPDVPNPPPVTPSSSQPTYTPVGRTDGTWQPPTGEPFTPLAPPAPGGATPYLPVSQPQHHVPPMTPPASENPPPSAAPGRQLYLPWVAALDDTCPLPVTQPPVTSGAPSGRKPRRNWPWVVSSTVLLLYVISIVGGGEKSSTSTATTAEPPSSAAPPAAAAGPPAPAPPAAHADLAPAFGDGTYVVGTDIVSGTYETTGPADGGFGVCSWSRLKDTSGNFGSIIATDVRQGPTTVTISKTDGAFVTAGCNPWQGVVSLDPRPPAG